MQNIHFEIDGETLILNIDLSTILGPSKSGKTLLIATTSGNAPVGTEGIKLGLNLYKPNPDYVPPKKGEDEDEGLGMHGHELTRRKRK